MKPVALFSLVLFTATLVFAIACGGGAPAPTPTNTPASTDSGGEESIKKSRRARPHISTIGDTLQFDRAHLKETAQYTVRLTFTNASTVNQHNWVLLKQGTKDKVAAAAVNAGAANSWIPPEDGRIIAHSGLLDPVRQKRYVLPLHWLEHISSFVPSPGMAPPCLGILNLWGLVEEWETTNLEIKRVTVR